MIDIPLAILTASTDPARAADCIASWRQHATHTDLPIIVLVNGKDDADRVPRDPNVTEFYIHTPNYLGSVPAFKAGMDSMLQDWPADIIACLHDDFRIDEDGWDEKVIRHFERHERCGLAGFGGAVGLGDADIYRKPYDPMQLARIGFRSNLQDAEAHGLRSILSEPVACLDGFSQIGRKAFWEGYRYAPSRLTRYSQDDRPWDVLDRLGFVHHFYDGALGCLAKRYLWETWYLPVRGHHFGGRTAVGDAGYATWAQQQTKGGDQGFWTRAHELGHQHFRNELPIRL